MRFVEGVSYSARKYYVALIGNERRLITGSLKNLRNYLLPEGKYTDAVDGGFIKIMRAKQKTDRALSFVLCNFLYALGEFPYFALKVRIKYGRLLKPVSPAISVILMFVFISISAATSNR